MKYKKRHEWSNFIEYRRIFHGGHRERCGSHHPLGMKFRKILMPRVLNPKRRVVNDWKRCYNELKGYDEWHRSDI